MDGFTEPKDIVSMPSKFRTEITTKQDIHLILSSSIQNNCHYSLGTCVHYVSSN